MEILKIWLLIVAALSVVGTLVATIDYEYLQATQFTVTPLTGRVYGAWTTVASVVRCLCAFHLRERGIYLATLFTFFVALAVYSFEFFVSGSVTITTASAPFVIASTSIIFMLVKMNYYIGSDKTKRM